MELIADILLVSGALAAGVYCVVLSRRLRRFTDLEKGVGGAIAVLSAQVDDMTKTLASAQVSAVQSAQSLDRLTNRAAGAARRLELLVASMHDIPDAPPAAAVQTPETAPPQPNAAPAPLAQTAAAAAPPAPPPAAAPAQPESIATPPEPEPGTLFLAYPVYTHTH